jgi:hypothetical protein
MTRRSSRQSKRQSQLAWNHVFLLTCRASTEPVRFQPSAPSQRRELHRAAMRPPREAKTPRSSVDSSVNALACRLDVREHEPVRANDSFEPGDADLVLAGHPCATAALSSASRGRSPRFAQSACIAAQMARGRLLRRASVPRRKRRNSCPHRGGPENVLTTPPRTRRWTAHELAELKRLANHASPEEIALALGRTVCAVRTKAAHKRILLHGDVPCQGPPRLRLPWEDARKRT